MAVGVYYSATGYRRIHESPNPEAQILKVRIIDGYHETFGTSRYVFRKGGGDMENTLGR